ncbi:MULTISPECIES: glycerophosphodiester phosphodiesterase [Acinetobacter]|uniref:glycerophosphodiester phosphodiesterase n=1 Tax=Acinetobacter TaxID=469 RepID=UPI000C5241F2|nr:MULTISPECIES: glycerophosphodiester phosphodiesterase [Acinetobacter]MEC8566687.1 glycerophosphodiester phosphodiesterase [Pseudomonadota bacterium]MBC68639.1 glycerophosphodiester phosphodiesterase [Acinetobacter sp.]MBT48683.1 glycerophosphodiester phosphodiesterase [Acinetobacter sp.]HIQ35384.1 glycerophosphodiester phosphodiesterase [Acinetobacter venetianus]HJP46938.1 glycerophosphodiester phosphodiesterase [Acinetobacter venetianus]|tara:strand:+ start:1457 stop:2593 length:1137 start_codon:yes stop_codon:yes gene_type:complete
MLKKAVICLSLISLVGCNDDNNDHSNTKHPTYEFPQILVVGHRGASALRPEHTLESYQKAIDDGADFIEPDLVSTKDGVLVARHENEISGTTNVAEVPEFADRKKTKVIDGVTLTGWFTEDFTLKELQQLKARERIPQYRPQNTQYNDLYDIPTLDQIIDLANKNYKKTGKIIGLYIETKHPTYFQNQNLAMEDKLLQTLAKYQYTRDIAPIYLQSFEVGNLKYLKQQLDLHKSVKHGQLIQLYDEQTARPADYVAAENPTTYGDMATAQGLKDVSSYANGVGPWKVYVFKDAAMTETTSFIQDAHNVGLKVHPYTFRPENNFLPESLKCSSKADERCETGSIKEMQLYFKAGVDGFFTDDPTIGRKAVQNYLSTQKK